MAVGAHHHSAAASLLLIVINVISAVDAGEKSDEVVTNTIPDYLPCNYTAYATGCVDPATTHCNTTSNLCVCNQNLHIHLRGRCFGQRDISELCLTSQQCEQISAKCVDAAGAEVSATAVKDEQYYFNHNILSGVCKCPDGSYFHQQERKCRPRVLETKCFFSHDCFHKSHATCDGGRCRCKAGFFHDYLSDECRPNLVTTLCLYGYVWDKETQKCRPNSGFHSGSYSHGESSISALFWPAVAFFLVIFLLRLLKEGMKRDCERVHEARTRRHSHHRVLRPRAFPAHALAHTRELSLGSAAAPRPQSEVIVLMPPGLPPPYSPGENAALSVPGVTEQPPSYEEATRSSDQTSHEVPAVTAK